MGRVLVTGAEGFIGRPLQIALAAAGHEVVALDRSADVTCEEALLQRAVPAEAVIHLAFPTRAERRRQHPLQSLGEVVAGTVNAARLAQACGAGQVLLASSGKVYGYPERLPLTEDHPTRPTTFLGELKLLQERLVLVAVSQGARSGWHAGATSLRVFNAYGPGQRAGFLVAHLVAGLRQGRRISLGELDHRRDYVHVDDVCQAFVCAMAQPAPLGTLRPLNVGTGQAVSARELLGRLAGIADLEPTIVQDPTRLRPSEAPEERADCQRLLRLGWAPRVGLEQGLRGLWLDTGS